MKRFKRRMSRILRKLTRRGAGVTRNEPALPAEPPEWERIPEWLPADKLRGWNAPGVSTIQQQRWVEFLRQVEGPGPLGVSHESDAIHGRENVWPHNLLMTYGYVLGRACQHRSSLSILDWGAGAGHYYVYSRALFPDLSLAYTAHDLPALCAAGRSTLPDVTFDDDAEQVLSRTYNFVMAGSSLWYAENWKSLLGRLAVAASEWVYVTRMIFMRQTSSFVAVQRPWKYGYDTEYQCWALNSTEFLQAAHDANLTLEREFIFGQAPAIHGCEEIGTFRGYLFRRPPANRGAFA